MSLFRFFLTWWGAFLMGALDSSMLFFLPLGIDTLVIYLAARNPDYWWAFPLLATAGSITGAAVTFWIGKKIGEAGLERLVSAHRLAQIRRRVGTKGTAAMAAAALIPPPFPLTAFILTSGALDVDRWQFFGTFGAARLLRFGAEAALTLAYGRGVLRLLESDGFRFAVMAFAVIAVLGTAMSAAIVWRNTRRRPAAA